MIWPGPVNTSARNPKSQDKKRGTRGRHGGQYNHGLPVRRRFFGLEGGFRQAADLRPLHGGQKGILRLQKADCRRPVVPGDNPFRMQFAHDGRRGRPVDRGHPADRKEQQVDLADRLPLFRAQRGLTEISEMGGAQAGELKHEDAVGTALRSRRRRRRAGATNEGSRA